MKRIISIILCIMLLPLNFALLASAEDSQLVRIVTDKFTGTAGSGAAGWTYAQSSGNAVYQYAQDPTDSTNSVLKMERTASGGRTKMRRDLGAIGNGKSFDRDMVITYRAYDAGDNAELQLCFRQYYKESERDSEGHSLFTVALHKSTTKNTVGKWLDVRAEIKKSGSYDITVKDGDTTVMSNSGSFAFHYPGDGHGDCPEGGAYEAQSGIWQLDFELHSSLIGAWYVDDFFIWTYEDIALPDITGMEEILNDPLDGAEGLALSGWGEGNLDNVKYVYAKDPENKDNSVAKLIRTSKGNRVKMYKYLVESPADYIDGNVLITFRAYDEDGTGRLNLYPRKETTSGEGAQIFGIEMEKKITPDIATGVWYNCYVEIKNNGVDTPTFSAWMIGDGAKISLQTDVKITNEFKGISRIDFENNTDRVGDWFVDDVCVYRDFRDELRAAADEITFDDIANGNQQSEVLTNLSLIDSVECDGVTYPVVWESSDENFILPDGTVTRRSFNNEVTLTAKVYKDDSKKIYVEKDFTVIVYKKDGADDNDVIKDYMDFYLKEELFTDEDTAKLTKDLKQLPTEGPDGMKITWESDSPAITEKGVVTRPAYGSGNATVILTATLLLNDATATKNLTYTVLQNPDPYININATLDLLTESYLTEEDSGRITKNLNLPTEGAGTATITWSAKPEGVISEKGVVTRGDEEVTVVLTALVEDGGVSLSEEFTFTVLPKIEKILEADLGGLILEGTPTFSESFDIPLAGSVYGTTFSWKSDSRYIVIDGDRAVVYNPPFDKGDVTVNITLTATFDGVDYTYNYPVKVSSEGTDEEIVDAIMADFSFEDISEESEASVKENLALVTEIGGVEVEWSTLDENDAEFVDTVTGEVYRPTPGSAPEEITLVATFSRGYVSKTMNLTFTVAPFESDAEVLEKAKNSLIPSVITSEKLSMITNNLNLPAEWKYGTNVTWKSEAHNSKYDYCLEIDGEEGIVTRPEWGCTSAKMVLTATISYKDLASVTRTYSIEILEKNYMEEYAELWREDFEAWDDAYGDEPDGGDDWSIDGNEETDQIKATIEQVAFEYGEEVKSADENKAFKADRSVINNGVGYVYAGATKAYGGIVYIGLDFMIPTGGEFKINGRNGAQDQVPVTIIINDEKSTTVYATGHNLPVPEGLVKPNAWNRIKLEINVAKEAYHVYINEECLTDGLDIVGSDGVGIDTTYGVPYNYYGQGYSSSIQNFRMVFQKGFKDGYYLDNAYMANTIMYTEAQLSLADAWEKEFLAKNDISRITDTLVFPAVEAQGVRIFFYSDDSKIIDTAGMIQLPSGEADVAFKVGFNDGFTEYTKSYKLHVIKDAKEELSDEDAVKKDLEEAVNTIKGSGMLTSLTNNLTIPTVGENGSSITVVSSNPSAVTNSGVITRGSSDKTATLTVKAAKNGVSSEEVQLSITVAKITESSSTKPSSGGGGGGSSIKVTYGEQTKGDTGIEIEQPENPEDGEKVKFSDLANDHWAYSELMYMVDNGIMNGTGDGNIEPGRKILREEFIKMLVVSLGLKVEDRKTAFTDVAENAWYAPYIAAAKKAGLVNGYEDGRAGIGEEITREDMAVIIFRAAEIAQSGADEIFTDDTQISGYAKNAVYTLKDIGVINGMGDGAFAPKASATRAETACMLYKAIKKNLIK